MKNSVTILRTPSIPKYQVNPARFLQYGIFYLEIHLLLNIPEVTGTMVHIVRRPFPSKEYFQVYEMLNGRERHEVKLMAVVVSLYYVQWMLRAKDTPRLV